MGKASYKIRETKNMRHFTYSGNLKDAIEKAKRDLQKEKENKEIAQWYWLYEKAKKAINTHNKKIANIEAFIRCAEEEQEKQKGKKDNETGYCKCCVDCNFIDQKGADELMCLAAYLAGNEQARAEAQQKAGKKA